ncbi:MULTISPECIES: dipeptide/oligopeptide/nickel ABC transporter permease/ATP-binding protein [unclassified Rathayibacter]|uniref:dipeptide/oligopeptide/nickel ABC transporter permease/ATP-binding protein n=1 Tax=unclassified Rathayibacter TaxID=2609250 RepID=UPI0009E94692|nr:MULTISPECIES: dipeptide/oligopeptide/nickel ABC transporter permease/ATP-binding protein [unclassified Rathayibacter]
MSVVPMTVRAQSTQGALRRFLRNPLAVIASVLLVLIVVAALLAPWLTPYDPAFADVTALNQGPSAEHLLGTDRAGRDVLSRLLIGGRVTLLAAAIAVVAAVAIGVPAGLLAGYFGGPYAAVGNGLTALVLSLPAVLVMLSVRAVVGPSVWITMLVFGICVSTSFYRLVRSSVSVVRNELYVDAAKVSGLRSWRILSRHVLAVVRAPIIVQTGLVAGMAIAAQSGLEFLGIGDRQVPTWGSQISEAFAAIYTSPALIAPPAVAIGLTCVCLGVLANGLRDALEDRGLAAPRRRRAVAAPAPTGAPPLADDVVLAVRGLRVGYPDGQGGENVVVDGVDLEVRRGEVLGLVGESGSGKSQTSFAVLGLLPSGGQVLAGSIRLDGKELVGAPEREIAALRGPVIAYVPQEPIANLAPYSTVGSQLIESLRGSLGLGRAEARARALELLASVGIREPERILGSYAHQISGGMAQRVLIAGAIAGDPDVLIADEPTTALDVTVQAEVLDLLRRLQRERRMALLLVTHDFGVVADLCDRVAVMNAGRIVEEASVDDLFSRPQHPYTRELLAATLDDVEPRPDLVTAEAAPGHSAAPRTEETRS